MKFSEKEPWGFMAPSACFDSAQQHETALWSHHSWKYVRFSGETRWTWANEDIKRSNNNFKIKVREQFVDRNKKKMRWELFDNVLMMIWFNYVTNPNYWNEKLK